MSAPDATQTARRRTRGSGRSVAAQLLFGSAIVLPCLLAARPSLRPTSTARLPLQVASDEARRADCCASNAGGARLVIHVEACRFELFAACGHRVIEGPCSTGSDATLRAPDGRTWTFRTPRGRRRVHHKAAEPVWYKPDWAFIEGGLPLPPADAESRYVRGMLGSHALDIGGGYLVHGSPYRIGIGTRTTHGCVRLLDSDLVIVYETLQIGDEVVLR